jgi:hypothetical protein
VVPLKVEHYKRSFAQTEIVITEFNCNFSVPMAKVVLNVTESVPLTI